MRIRVWRLSALLITLTATGTAAADAPEWRDGTPIVRFDKRDDAAMEAVADWEGLPERGWAGPAIWTNRLQDWRVTGGALQSCPEAAYPCRTAHILTRALEDVDGPFRLETVLTLAPGSAAGGWAGFLIGAGAGRLDYRGAALVHHRPGKGGGLLAVVETAGEGGLSFRDMTRAGFPKLEAQGVVVAKPIRLDYHRMMINLEGSPRDDGTYDLRLSVWAHHAGDLLGAAELRGVASERLLGNVALAAHPGQAGVRHRFEALKAGGPRLARHPERAFGPVAGALYSLDGPRLKLSAQFLPVDSGERPGGPKRRPAATLEVRPAGSGGVWAQVDEPKVISAPDYHVLFRSDRWDASQDYEARVAYEDADGAVYRYPMRIRKDPVGKPVVSAAGFTGMGVMGHVASAGRPKPAPGLVAIGKWTPANVWFPFAEAVDALREEQDVDLLFFMGDQVYESKPTWRADSRMPLEDYLYKWILWHWAFRDITRDRPAVVQPDDHDVYHGNLWGWGGRLCPTDHNASGGYICAPYFVNMVHRTQTSHNPGPYDPAPALNGITNYYGAFTYGGVGFAVLEDRKFKTPPDVTDPKEQTLLGETQLRFLEEWGADWEGQAAKVVVSQTVYAAMHCRDDGTLFVDPDCNGFPKAGRDRAVRAFREAGAFVLCGDQHLATFAQLGIGDPSHGVYQFCVPAMGNIFWRWFYPAEAGANRAPGMPEHLGDFTDPWGNPFRMLAVANPEEETLYREAGAIRSRHLLPVEEFETGPGDSERTSQGDGYGIIRLDKAAREITAECWPHNARPSEGDEMFQGWPVTVPFETPGGE